MIVWSGWGGVGILIPLLGALLGLGLFSAVAPDQTPVGVGLGLILGAVGTWFFGQWVNITRPKQQAEEFMTQRRAELQHLVDSGQFHIGPGYPPPSSHQEAQQQAAMLYDREVQELVPRLRNRHTVFWMPAQYAAFIAAGVGVIVMVVGLTQ